MGKGRAEKWTPKWLDNKMKAKGLQKLKWYCQMCQKQCRDENGFKCHRTSEQHLRQMQLFIQRPGKYMNDFSREFESTFMRLLSTRYRSTRVLANQVYQDLISDKQHVHMNSTAWCTLTGFVLYLGRTGKAKIEKTERGWYLEYIDRERMEREAKYQADKKQEADEEKQEERRIAKQVRMAKVSAGKDDVKEIKATTLDRKNDTDKVELEVMNLIDVKRNAGRSTKQQNITPKVNVLEEAAVKAAKDEAELWMKMEEDEDEDVVVAIDDDEYPSSSPNRKKQRRDDSDMITPATTSCIKKESAHHHHNGDERASDAWLTKGLIVKVLNKGLCEGKYYKSKGEIRKVISPYVCHVKILKTGDVLELDQEDLQTVTPANGRTIQVVLGQYRDQFGVLKNVDVTTGECTVILEVNKEEVKLRPEDICKV
ncbi:hypothetical protein FOL46_009065 [Perkinsus olseni]|uniref:DNA/RNA-binding protein Kin17 WH-like domain-containing protein n=1 Tax=Perkinsus olseni TaxID=32597 RepID=A0A7J6L3J4_PEROL|nr:hypothetical protein FOL46_009065 [Perkinsus olseni]